jgi:hapalindole H/12-epi-hapalindole U/12-epi-fischerindole U synthase
MTRFCLTLIASLLVAGVAWASPIEIKNPGFEEDVVEPNSFPALTPQGWRLYDPKNIWNGENRAIGVLNPTDSSFFPEGAPEGHNVALTWLKDGDNQDPLGLSQTLTATLTVNTRYTLKVDVGNIDSGKGSGWYAQFGFSNIKGFPGYTVQLLAGGVVIAEDNNSLAATLPEGTFATSTIQVDIGDTHPQAGQKLEIRLINLNGPGTPEAPGIEVDFDNVRLDASPL